MESGYSRPADDILMQARCDVEEMATRWKEVAEILSLAQGVWKKEFPEVYKSSVVRPEDAFLEQLDKLGTSLKPTRRDLIGVGRDAGKEDDTKQMVLEEGRWLKASNQKLRKRVERSKLSIKAAFGHLPPGKSTVSGIPGIGQIPAIGMPEMPKMPKLEIPQVVPMPKMGGGGSGFFSNLFGDTPRSGDEEMMTESTVTEVTEAITESGGYVSSDADEVQTGRSNPHANP